MKQRSDLFGLRVKLPPVTIPVYNHSNAEAVQFSALPNDTTSELAGLSPEPFEMLNVKQESCEYQILKSFG